MAYMDQERKAELVALAKPVLARYGLRATFSVRHHTVLVCHIARGRVDFARGRVGWNDQPLREWDGYAQVNVYHIGTMWQGTAREALLELHAALNTGNHDNSDLMSDYFDVGWYVDINIGTWDRPYVFEGS
jgi:hypothetical protein